MAANEPLRVLGAWLALVCVSHSAWAYTIKTYHGDGASRIQACSLARNDALAPGEEAAHGHLVRLARCDCTKTQASDRTSAWHCLVQAVHDR